MPTHRTTPHEPVEPRPEGDLCSRWQVVLLIAAYTAVAGALLWILTTHGTEPGTVVRCTLRFFHLNGLHTQCLPTR
ncbi:hypothetical protein [Kitasatospora sp. NPDC057223]|uniref:hypothetical protein n=1 Tax=Kitasatospora sp. NPDC057223 TaxID=3346055 RepID=UPI003638281D